jgi:diacylglycerol kinase
MRNSQGAIEGGREVRVDRRDTSVPRAWDSAPRRRSAWRERLIDAECGLRLCLRSDGTLFAYLFAVTCIVAAGIVIRLDVREWAMVILAVTVVLSAGIFNQMLRLLVRSVAHHLPRSSHDAAKVGSTAVLVASIGAAVTVILVFGQRIAHFRGW